MDVTERLSRQIAFLVECDRLKDIFRQSLNIQSRRHENDAEHSWALCLFAIVLAEHSDVPIDVTRVLKMLLVHDLVEIDAGDTYAYDTARLADQHERETIAAERIFGLLPDDQAVEFRGLWDEFETKQTAESKFATAIDRIQPMLLNCLTEGVAWTKHGITHGQVMARNASIANASEGLWAYIRSVVDDAVRQGHLQP